MINALVDEVIQTLVPAYPDTVSIARYTGRFGERDLDRFAGRAPALLVAAQNLSGIASNQIPAQPMQAGDKNPDPRHRLDATLRMAIAVVAKDKPKQSRDEVALDLIDTLLQTLPTHAFATAAARVNAGSITGQNLHSPLLDSRAVTLWGITFDLALRLEYGAAPAYKKPAKVFLAKDEVTL